jgi:O-antigen/teichoic acid export membrane protein
MSLVKSILNVLSNRILGNLAGVLILPILLLKLSVEEIGALGLLTITPQILSIGMLGITKAIPRFFSDKSDGIDIQYYNGLWGILLVINTIIIYFSCESIWLFVFNQNLDEYAIYLVFFFVNLEIDNYLQEWHITLNKTPFLRNVKLIQILTSLLLTYYLLVIKDLGIDGRLLALLIPGLVIGLFVLLRLRFYRVSFNWVMWWKYISYSKSLALSSLGTVVLTYMDRIMIIKLLPDGTATYGVGLYEIANKIANVLKSLVNSIGRVFQVRYNEIFAVNYRLADRYASMIMRLFIRRMTGLIIVFNLCALIGLLLLGKFNQIYLYILPILTLGYWVRLNYIGYIIKLSRIGLENKLFHGTLYSGSLNVLLNLVLIPNYGIFAAAVTTLISHIFLFIYFNKKIYGKFTMSNLRKWYVLILGFSFFG